MTQQPWIDNLVKDAVELFTTPNAFRSVIILIIALLVAYWLSNFLAKAIILVAKRVAIRSDNESNDLRATKLRQTETYLSIAIAVVRALAVAVVGYLAWRALSPFSSDNSSLSNGIAAISAGTVFIVVAGQTVGLILRDLTTGSIMISEGWYKIGDFIKVEPFMDVSGVVEQFNLRSTKIRALNGEVIWVHNQQIMAAHVTPYGVRTLDVDVFVRDKEKGLEAIKKIISAIPKGKTMLAKPLKITATEEWGENRWRITVTGQTAPGREWLIESFFVQAIKDLDEGKEGSDKLVSLPPMSRYSDEAANRHFRRAVRVQQEQERADNR